MALDRAQAIWLARGAALGVLVQQLRRRLHAPLSKLRDLGFSGKGLPKRL